MKSVNVIALLLMGSVAIVRSADAQTAPAPEVKQAAPATRDEAPTHVSTGWSALFKDTVGDFKTFPKRPSTWVILGIGGAAAGASHLGDDYVRAHVVGNRNAERFFTPGQYIGGTYTAVAASVGVWAVGRYIIGPGPDGLKANKWSETGFDLMRAEILSQAIVQGTKRIARRDRPTGECCSFPSGHAASAFAMAAVLERHLGYRGSLPFFAGAMYVATSRLVDDRHFLSDVMFGAAVGTASGWTVVGHRGPNQFTTQPVPVKGGMMIVVTRGPDQSGR